ncbi:helix-turn-helix domain-containing protein [Caproiciproducens sp. CPB-2]|uniref:helix-turn-helix domain-containing protein n=1 Tax=Caproiciproducens sp. CPB-2 TaxID=3030017 RepID=UPI0023DA699D|nr:helix-turn-helix transcriptional regulator [Caproiciproducens sp. CPB-2]MDF1493374.1 helix-turn-helix transcriptional regulator [Caproiciproducens sp. CPB-2]
MVARRLKELRTEHKLTQNDIAALLNISREAYCMYENQKRQLNYESLCILADYYHVTLDYLFGRSDRPDLTGPLGSEEKLLLEYYRAMDQRGRENVMGMAKVEYQRGIKRRDFSEPVI